MKRRILAILHSRTGHPGYVGSSLKARGYEIERVRVTCGQPLPDEPDSYAGVISFGGPMSANDESVPGIVTEMEFIDRVLAADVPFLGICLGAQLLARVLGAAVSPHPEKFLEAGYFAITPARTECELFDDPLYVYHWHEEGFELPSGARLMATGANFTNQAYRLGDRHYGLQFHPEMTRSILASWIRTAGHKLVGPIAQTAEVQHSGHDRHKHALRVWLERFWDHWPISR